MGFEINFLYSERLRHLKLTSLEHSRLVFDLVMCYKRLFLVSYYFVAIMLVIVQEPGSAVPPITLFCCSRPVIAGRV